MPTLTHPRLRIVDPDDTLRPPAPRSDLIPFVAAFFASLGWSPVDMFTVDLPVTVAQQLVTAMATLEASGP